MADGSGVAKNFIIITTRRCLVTKKVNRLQQMKNKIQHLKKINVCIINGEKHNPRELCVHLNEYQKIKIPSYFYFTN